MNVPFMPVDHKSSKRRGEIISLSNQFIGYAWLLGTHNVMVNKIGFQKTLKPSERFTRATLSYTSDVINEWAENAVFWIKLQRHHDETGNYPRNYTSCDKWGGCVYRPICETERGARDYKIRQLFDVKEVKWDVGAKL